MNCCDICLPCVSLHRCGPLAVLTQTHVHTILTEISNAALSVLFHQYVFALQVSVGNSWLAMSAKDLDM